jgi:hypothetical protein
VVEDRCKLVAADVLLRLRLDILMINNNDYNESPADSEILLYSSEKLNCTAHPRWDHLDEQLLLRFDDLKDVDDDDLLSHLHARFSTVRDCHDHHVNDDETIVLAEVSLHPTNLRRLPTKHDDDIDYAKSISTSGKNNMIIPESLPPNAILLHYNDGYTRVVPDLYGLLVKKGIISENVIVDPLRKNVDEENGGGGGGGDDDDNDDDKNRSVFEDDAFNMLGTESMGSTTDNFSTRSAMNSTTTAAGIDDRVFNLLDASVYGHETVEKVPDIHASKILQQHEVDDETLDTSILAEETDSRDAMNNLGRNEERLSPVELLPPDVDPSSELLPLHSSDMGKRSAADIDNEIEELRLLVYHERKLLEQEKHLIEEESNCFKRILVRLRQLDQETVEIMKTTGVESADLFRSEFRLEAHRIRLLKQLQLIFPIRVMSINITVNPPQYPQHQYTIASIPLPDDIHSVSVSDDQVSTSIGFLCYLVSLTSKYLAVTPRYKLICRFSRSAIIDDLAGTMSSNNKPSTVYPLFRERGAVDKEQLNHGFALLVRNIDCLLEMRQVDYYNGWNALAKMEKLFMHVVDGPSLG